MALTPTLMKLMEHEKVIEQGLASFLEVGNALLAIREHGWYGEAGYDSWEAYCRGRWGITPQYAGNLMRSTKVAEVLESETAVSPSAEWQIRPLTPLPVDEQIDAWNDAVERSNGEPTERHVRQAVARIEKRRPSKPDLGGGISHPARYSSMLLPLFGDLLRLYAKGPRVLDPFAGTGRIHELRPEWETTGVEIEPEWADLHEHTIVGNALDLSFDDASFDAIVTSPTYGNRLADKHNAQDESVRRSYTHDLGRRLSDDNSGVLQWGEAYRDFHERAWAEAVRTLRPDGVFVLNIKDHVRDGALQLVSAWHCWCLGSLGLRWVESRAIGTGNLRQGTNADLRDQEQVHVYVQSPNRRRTQ